MSFHHVYILQSEIDPERYYVDLTTMKPSKFRKLRSTFRRCASSDSLETPVWRLRTAKHTRIQRSLSAQLTPLAASAKLPII